MDPKSVLFVEFEDRRAGAAAWMKDRGGLECASVFDAPPDAKSYELFLERWVAEKNPARVYCFVRAYVMDSVRVQKEETVLAPLLRMICARHVVSFELVAARVAAPLSRGRKKT